MGSPSIIFGCANFGITWTSTEKIRVLAETLKAAGVQQLDTAARYPPTSPGLSQRLIGEAALADSGFAVDTKILVAPPHTGGSLSEAAIDESIANSLDSLQVSKVHTLYCHAPDYETPISEQAVAFDKHYRNGVFERLGVSNFTLEMIEEWIKIATEKNYVKPSVYQGQYNLLCRTLEEDLFPVLRKHAIHFNAFSPLAGGFLTGKLTLSAEQPEAVKGTRFDAEQGNVSGRAFRHWYDKPSMHGAMKRLQMACEKEEVATGAVAMRWLMYHSALEEGDGIIAGASRTEQVDEMAKAIAAGPLPSHLVDEINAIWQLCQQDAKSIVQY